MSNLALITLHQSVNVQFELHAMLTLESEGIRLAVAALPEMIKRLDLNLRPLQCVKAHSLKSISADGFPVTQAVIEFTSCH
jgi:hypothetical protein